MSHSRSFVHSHFLSNSHSHPNHHQWIRRTCTSCGNLYYLLAAVAFVDTGRCISCDNEIDALERWFAPPPDVPPSDGDSE